MHIDEAAVKAEAYGLLAEAYGPEADFRSGQLDAIVSAVAGKKTLVVQKTGWGKSLVYFLATRILRMHGSGPTLIISPLLALMKNQIEAAENQFGLSVATINSENSRHWEGVFDSLRENAYDAIVVSPERLGNPNFADWLPGLLAETQLFVVDEAHCISDWGHDFRPDYQRIVKIIHQLPSGVGVLGTTATANDRVIEDIKQQLGNDLLVVRGDLMRDNLAIHVNPSQTKEERLAWLVQNLSNDSRLAHTQGIVYCLTKFDCDFVSAFLKQHGISAASYYSGSRDQRRRLADNLRAFECQELRVLCATTKLGMGYDNLNIGFVVNYQLPVNIINYYQQIGRAGRKGQMSFAVLLHGPEDDEILQSFSSSRFVRPDLLASIVDWCAQGATQSQLLWLANVPFTMMSKALKYLVVHEYLLRDGQQYVSNSAEPFDRDAEAARQEALNAIATDELNRFKTFLSSESCLMEQIARELDAPDAHVRGICSNCADEPLFSSEVDAHLVDEARNLLSSKSKDLRPRAQWYNRTSIPKDERNEPGAAWVLDRYSWPGRQVLAGRKRGQFTESTIASVASFLKARGLAANADLIVPVPSWRSPCVSQLAYELGLMLGIPVLDAVERTKKAPQQYEMKNSAFKQRNVEESTGVAHATELQGKRVLLVDDLVDSGWTFTVVGSKLRRAGAASVTPFALLNTGNFD